MIPKGFKGYLVFGRGRGREIRKTLGVASAQGARNSQIYLQIILII